MAEKDILVYNDLDEDIKYLEPNQGNHKDLLKKKDVKVKLKHNANKMTFYALRRNEHRRFLKVVLEYGYTVKKYFSQLGSTDVIIWEVEFDIPVRFADDSSDKEGKGSRFLDPDPNVTVGDAPQ